MDLDFEICSVIFKWQLVLLPLVCLDGYLILPYIMLALFDNLNVLFLLGD